MSRSVMLMSNFYIVFGFKNEDRKEEQYYDQIFSNCNKILAQFPSKRLTIEYGPTTLIPFSKALRRFFTRLKIEPRLMLDICRVNNIFVDPNQF